MVFGEYTSGTATSVATSRNQFVFPGPARRRRPKKTWSQTVNDDVKTLFRNVDPINRQAWKAAIKNWTSTSTHI